MAIDPIVTTPPTQLPQPGATPPSAASKPSPNLMRPDRVERSDAHSKPSHNTYSADVLCNALGGADAVAASAAAATWGAAQRLGPTLSELASRATSVTTTAAPIAGETLGAAGLVLAVQSSAGNVGEAAPNAAWRQRSNAVADRTPQQAHTTFPGQRVDVGADHTTNPAHVRPVMDGILTTPAETQSKPVSTGHASPDLRGLTQPTGAAIHQPKAVDHATLAEQDKILRPEYAVHLTPSGTLVNADKAVIDVERKINGYSLNPQHGEGAHKARVFKSVLGYDKQNSQDLVKQIRARVQSEPAVPGKINEFGTQFGVDIPVIGPKGAATVRTGWIYDPGSDVPRLTTAVVKI